MGLMYSKLPNLVLGFHGCSKTVYENVIVNGSQLNKSNNTYDWLGNGIYFWEQNYERAKECTKLMCIYWTIKFNKTKEEKPKSTRLSADELWEKAGTDRPITMADIGLEDYKVDGLKHFRRRRKSSPLF